MNQIINELKSKTNEIKEIALSKNDLKRKCELIYHQLDNLKPVLFLTDNTNLTNKDNLFEYYNRLKSNLITCKVITINAQTLTENENWSKLTNKQDIVSIFGLCMAIYFEIISLLQ